MAQNMIQATVNIVGTRPFFWHCFTPEALALEKKERTGVAGNDPSEWRSTASVDRDGHLYFDSSYAFACIREGGRHIKRGKSNLISPISSTLQLVGSNKIYVDRWWPGYPNGERFEIETADEPPRDPDEPVYLDVRGVKNPSTKARNVRYRVAASLGWRAEFTIQWDKTIVSRNEMHSAIIDGGKLAGVGNGRNIGMGRFEVEKFEITE